ncbi:MAG: cysteine--tRNA ligase [Anaerolineaceae bacterium]|nr:MAG: cysteine--tRNA ligase [Anaerolineaceae bacterium]
MTLRIFNVLGRQKQNFQPLEEGRIGIYVCGPTVYDVAHLGHAKSYISFDMVVRWLRFSGYDVLYVQNITDVGHLTETETGEDKILKQARALQAKPMQIVETYTRSYFDDMDALGVQRPDISPRASGHVPEQIKMIEELIDKGFAYEVNGSVYFDVSEDEDYGKLSNRRVEEQDEGVREEVRDEKRSPADFALWKRAEPDHILRWDSPWGEGFPGWHIECSAMAKKYLGATFDIHGGGIDNIFPHNECEIAQSESANDAPFANYWMLVGSLNVPDAFDGTPVKMSKSLGNFVSVKDALSVHRPEVIRLFTFSAHYSNPVTYSEEAIHAASAGWERLNNAYRLTRRQMETAPEGDAGNGFLERVEKARADFTSAMNDDFNAPKAVATLQEFTRDVNSLLNGTVPVGLETLRAIHDVYAELGGDVLGILRPTDAAVNTDAKREAGLIELLIQIRADARKNKDFATSDRIRDELSALGVTLEDRPDGTLWKAD